MTARGPLFSLELQGRGIDAEPLPGRLRAVLKDMAQMPSADLAIDLGTGHAVGAVLPVPYIIVKGRAHKAGPAGAGIELVIGPEQDRTAGRAAVDPLFMVVDIGAAEGPFRALFP